METNRSLSVLWRIRDLRDERLTPSHYALLYAITAFWKDGLFVASVDDLARATGLSSKQARRLLHELRAMGRLNVTQRAMVKRTRTHKRTGEVVEERLLVEGDVRPRWDDGEWQIEDRFLVHAKSIYEPAPVLPSPGVLPPMGVPSESGVLPSKGGGYSHRREDGTPAHGRRVLPPMGVSEDPLEDRSEDRSERALRADHLINETGEPQASSETANASKANEGGAKQAASESRPADAAPPRRETWEEEQARIQREEKARFIAEGEPKSEEERARQRLQATRNKVRAFEGLLHLQPESGERLAPQLARARDELLDAERALDTLVMEAAQ